MGAEMRLLCTVGRHQPNHARIYNDGLYFSACDRCGVDLIQRPAQPWRTVPKGHAVVWKPRTGYEIFS
jgi:hypothetical protein